jgi:hypothetical protein
MPAIALAVSVVAVPRDPSFVGDGVVKCTEVRMADGANEVPTEEGSRPKLSGDLEMEAGIGDDNCGELVRVIGKIPKGIEIAWFEMRKMGSEGKNIADGSSGFESNTAPECGGEKAESGK